MKSSARKQGVGKALIGACEARARALGFCSMVLSTQPGMLPAQALYRRLGYERNPDRDWSNKNGKSYIAFEKKLDNK